MGKRMTKAYAAAIIGEMLYEHECNSAWIDFSSECDDEIEKAERWEERQKAMQMAIRALKR